MRRVWNARLLAAGLMVALAAALAVAGAASARDSASSSSAGGVSTLDYPTVIHIEGASNKTCDVLDSYGSPGASWLELKFEGGDRPSVGSSKTLGDSYLSVTLTQTATDVWSWTSTQGIDAVLVKSGASGHNLYLYDPPTEATSGSGLTVPGKNGTSHVSFCYDKEDTPPPPTNGQLKVVKVLAGEVPDGVAFGDFSFAVDGGTPVAFDTDGVSDELQFAAGTSHDVVEPEANGDGYTTTYSDECSDGLIVAGETIVCTITNTFQHSTDPGSLQISKTAVGHYDIQHHWTIDKQVKPAGAADEAYGDDAVLDLADGGAGSVTWKVTVADATSETNFLVDATIVVSNPNAKDVTGVGVSDPDGVVDCGPAEGAQSTGLTVPANGSITCSFVGSPESKIPTNTATATWGNDQSVSATATIAWSKGADLGTPAVVNDGGALDDESVNGPKTFTYDEGWTCQDGTASPNDGRTNTATVTWNGGSDSDSASVQVGCGETPPPPNPDPEPKPKPTPTPTHPHGSESMDLRILKDAPAQAELVNGHAQISYQLWVRNEGPNQAHNVVVSDSAPSGVTFLAVTTQPDNGSCTITAGLLSCSLGTLGPGVPRIIRFTADVTQPGTYENCATIVGDGGETNPGNNTGCATTLVPSVLTPPTTPTKPNKPAKPAKPQARPKPRPAMCRVLRVNTKLVRANGHKHGIVAKVTRSRNPVKGVVVRFQGVGVSKAARTNGKGVARITLRTSKAGIIRVHIVNAKACNTARIGVVGVFQPPVTG